LNDDDAHRGQKTAVYRAYLTPWQGVALWEYLLHLVDSFNICQHLSTSFNLLNFQVVAGVSANGVYQSAQICAD